VYLKNIQNGFLGCSSLFQMFMYIYLPIE